MSNAVADHSHGIIELDEAGSALVARALDDLTKKPESGKRLMNCILAEELLFGAGASPEEIRTYDLAVRCAAGFPDDSVVTLAEAYALLYENSALWG